MTTKKSILLIALLALVSLMIAPVMAETLTGTLGSGGISTTSFRIETDNVNYLSPTGFERLYVAGIEYTGGLHTIVRFDDANEHICFSHNPPPVGNTTPVIASYAGQVIGIGTFGYQRFFDGAFPISHEINGYQYLAFNSWNATGLTGNLSLTLTYPWDVAYPTLIGDPSLPLTSPNPDGFMLCGYVNPVSPIPYGKCSFGVSGDYIETYNFQFSNDYTATKPSGIGIQGYVNKTILGTINPSKATIYDAVTGVGLTGDDTVRGADLYFNVPFQSIIIGVTDTGMNHYNSSVLFAAPVPTVTPTPTTTIPAGYVRNNLYVWDQNDAQIVGADVDVLDVEAGTWTNTTADPDGWITIDTLPYHTVNVYAHYPTSNIYLSNEILGLETGYYGGHNWVIVLYPYTTTPTGFVTLYINTRDYDSKAVLTNVNLQIKNLVTLAVTGESTGSTDSVTTVVTNATNYQITGSKSGYLSKTININSGETSSKTVVVELSKATVTPAITSTIPPGGITPVVTPDPAGAPGDAGYSNAKGQEIMDYLASHGMELVSICFVVTILGLLKMVSKK